MFGNKYFIWIKVKVYNLFVMFFGMVVMFEVKDMVCYYIEKEFVLFEFFVDFFICYIEFYYKLIKRIKDLFDSLFYYSFVVFDVFEKLLG